MYIEFLFKRNFMATFQVSKKNKNKTTKNLKVIFGWVIIAISTLG